MLYSRPSSGKHFMLNLVNRRGESSFLRSIRVPSGLRQANTSSYCSRIGDPHLAVSCTSQFRVLIRWLRTQYQSSISGLPLSDDQGTSKKYSQLRRGPVGIIASTSASLFARQSHPNQPPSSAPSLELERTSQRLEAASIRNTF